MLKKFPLCKINVTKMHSFFFREFQLISFTFDLQFLYELKHMVHFSKTVCEIFDFVFITFYIFVQQKG